MEFDRANIDNLTSLWRRYGARTLAKGAQASLLGGQSWPHRYWIEWHKQVEGEVAGSLSELLAQIPAQGIVPVWHCRAACPGGGDNCRVLESLLCSGPFSLVTELTAMTLDLQRYSRPAASPSALSLKPVQGHRDAETWAAIGSEAFAYRVEPQVITSLLDQSDIELYLGEVAGEPVATALLHRTDELVGLHQMGVPAKYQGRGYGQQMMSALMAQSLGGGDQRWVLQASTAGRPLYERFGFEAQFIIRNYQRNYHSNNSAV